MKQSRLESAIETTLDMATGFIISVAVYHYFILPHDWVLQNAILVTTIFTAISFVRRYFWRRFFNGIKKPRPKDVE